MEVGQQVKLFTARMFGVVVTARVLWVSKDKSRAKVRCTAMGGVSWEERINAGQLVTE